ncbi:MAG: hypothetical protein J5J06_00475 [Phycisphaerae bacterium]|nr:hypothetical protein [Phycisphaerae bacterium]
MNRDCEYFVERMADALGSGTPATPDPELAMHLQTCADCRKTWDEALHGLRLLRELPEPVGLEIRAEEDRVFIFRSSSAAAPGTRYGSILRYAAAILLAFLAGFAARSWLPGSLSEAGNRSAPQLVRDDQPRAAPVSVETALVRAHQRNPGSSDLAKLLIAVSPSRR